MVITSALHAEGRQFNSGRKQLLLSFFIYIFYYFKIFLPAVLKLSLEIE